MLDIKKHYYDFLGVMMMLKSCIKKRIKALSLWHTYVSTYEWNEMKIQCVLGRAQMKQVYPYVGIFWNWITGVWGLMLFTKKFLMKTLKSFTSTLIIEAEIIRE